MSFNDLINACYEGNLEDVIYFCEKFFVNIFEKDSKAISILCKYGYVEILKYFNENYDIDFSFRYNKCITDACKYGHLDVVIFLCEMCKGVNICARDNEPLKIACRKNHLNIIKYLFENQLKNIGDNADDLLDYSFLINNLEVIEYLCKNFPHCVQLDMVNLPEYSDSVKKLLRKILGLKYFYLENENFVLDIEAYKSYFDVGDIFSFNEKLIIVNNEFLVFCKTSDVHSLIENYEKYLKMLRQKSAKK